MHARNNLKYKWLDYQYIFRIISDETPPSPIPDYPEKVDTLKFDIVECLEIYPIHKFPLHTRLGEPGIMRCLNPKSPSSPTSRVEKVKVDPCYL